MTGATGPGILIIGCGRMGGALLRSVVHNTNAAVFAVDPSADKKEERLKGARAFDTLRAFSEAKLSYHFVIFAVKPQQMAEAAEEFRALGLHRDERGRPVTVISVAAGVKCAFFTDILGKDIPVARAMPNIAVALGYGMTGFYATPNMSEIDAAFIEEIFDGAGLSCRLQSEDQIDAVTALSGSGPAYFFYMAECMAAAGEKLGLPRDVAEAAAAATLTGAGVMMSEGRLAELRERVASPGGTTAQALAAFSANNALGKLTEKAMRAAASRAAELARMTEKKPK